ncbi:MAG: hypothetical protein KAT48_02680 [Bacteroidales bacterium]|nr:hypothetical protein [Bacteroidales bacterium]
MNNSNIKAKYQSKARQSFESKFKLYLFDKYLQDDVKSISLEDFGKFVISKDLVTVYTTKYWNWDTTVPFSKIPNKTDYIVKTMLTIDDLYENMKIWRDNNLGIIKTLQKDYISNFETVFPFIDFTKLLESDHCYYCGITIEKINELIDKEQIFKKKPTRGFTFEIDRKWPNEEYTRENSVMCCYWCNNAKTDEFTEKEFFKIGDVLKEIWNERLIK